MDLETKDKLDHIILTRTTKKALPFMVGMNLLYNASIDFYLIIVDSDISFKQDDLLYIEN